MRSDNVMEQNENIKSIACGYWEHLKSKRDYYNTTKMLLRDIRASLVIVGFIG